MTPRLVRLLRRSLVCGVLAALALGATAWLAPAWCQSVSLDLGQGGQAGTTSRLIQLTMAMTVLSLAPSLLVMMTAFTRIVIVLSLLRSGIGAQGTPPNTVIIGLALFLTFFVMQPTLQEAWDSGMLPLARGQTAELDGLKATAEPFRKFMLLNARPADLTSFLDIAKLAPPAKPQDMPWRALIPAFMVGELRRAFEMGFLLFLPFLIIDMVVASVLMSMGMMMLPPTTVSLPFKLVFFVLVDGWRLISGSLVQSFHT
jgi:flagellar biosynthetic protein FliP